MVVAATPSPDESNNSKEKPDHDVIVATSDPFVEERVRGVLATVSGVAVRSWPPMHSAEVLSDVVGGATRGVIFGPGLERETLLELAGQVHANHPDIAVVIIRKPSKPLLLGALKVGAREVVSPDAPFAEMRATLLRALGFVDRSSTEFVSTEARPISEAVAPGGIATAGTDQPSSLGSRTQAAWWSRGDGKAAVETLRSSIASDPGMNDETPYPSESFGPPERDDGATDETDEIEALVSEARATLEKLMKVHDHHATARDEIERANAIIAELASEITSALEQIHWEAGQSSS